MGLKKPLKLWWKLGVDFQNGHGPNYLFGGLGLGGLTGFGAGCIDFIAVLQAHATVFLRRC
jgi:hypothetical protein